MYVTVAFDPIAKAPPVSWLVLPAVLVCEIRLTPHRYLAIVPLLGSELPVPLRVIGCPVGTDCPWLTPAITAIGLLLLLTVIVTVVGVLGPFASVAISVTTYIPGRLNAKVGFTPVSDSLAPLYTKFHEYDVMDDGRDFEPSKVTVVPCVTVWSGPASAAGTPPETKVIVADEEVAPSVIEVPYNDPLGGGPSIVILPS